MVMNKIIKIYNRMDFMRMVRVKEVDIDFHKGKNKDLIIGNHVVIKVLKINVIIQINLSRRLQDK